MQLANMRNIVGILAVASFIQGCAMTNSENTGAKVGKVVVLASAIDSTNSGYVTNSANRAVRSALEECVRSSSWESANEIGECADAMPVVDQPTESQAPGSALVSYNGRALFDFDSATLSGAGQRELDQLTAKLNAQDDIEAIEIVGHADSIGSETYNQVLSENRADAVKVYLQRSLRSVKVRSKGMGESAPIADNSTDAGRRLNRRVEVNLAAMVEK